MKPILSLSLSLSIALSCIVAAAACGGRVVAVEVLPPRVSATCSAPAPKSPAGARGLLDLSASEILHGAYQADLRITSRGEVAVDGVELAFALPDGAGSESDEAAAQAAGTKPAGALYLAGDDEDPTSGILEDVVLLPRALAVAIFDDDGVKADEIEYATVEVTIKAASAGVALTDASTTFPIDVCRGCLVAEPTDEECEGGFEEASVCRPGQDVELYRCKSAPAATFP